MPKRFLPENKSMITTPAERDADDLSGISRRNAKAFARLRQAAADAVAAGQSGEPMETDKEKAHAEV